MLRGVLQQLAKARSNYELHMFIDIQPTQTHSPTRTGSYLATTAEPRKKPRAVITLGFLLFLKYSRYMVYKYAFYIRIFLFYVDITMYPTDGEMLNLSDYEVICSISAISLARYNASSGMINPRFSQKALPASFFLKTIM